MPEERLWSWSGDRLRTDHEAGLSRDELLDLWGDPFGQRQALAPAGRRQWALRLGMGALLAAVVVVLSWLIVGFVCEGSTL